MPKVACSPCLAGHLGCIPRVKQRIGAYPLPGNSFRTLSRVDTLTKGPEDTTRSTLTPKQENMRCIWTDALTPAQKSLFGFGGSVLSGLLYGVNFNPPTYVANHMCLTPPSSCIPPNDCSLPQYGGWSLNKPGCFNGTGNDWDNQAIRRISSKGNIEILFQYQVVSINRAIELWEFFERSYSSLH